MSTQRQLSFSMSNSQINMNTQEDIIEKDLLELLIKYRGVQSSIESAQKSLAETEHEIERLSCEQETLFLCKPIISDIINKFSDTLLNKLEELITCGLKSIFYDRDYSLIIQTTERRNNKCVDLFLNDGGNLIPVKNSCVAGGILVVIASIIQIFYVLNVGVEKIIFLDEQYSQISEQYVDYFMDFIHKLCIETGLSIVLITHDAKFMKHGDRVYIADKGKFTLKETMEETYKQAASRGL